MNQSKELETEIVELMKCSACEQFLRPPIYSSSQNAICSNCKGSKDSERNNLVENIGKLLRFPCKYHSFGCPTLIKWENANIHESVCTYRQYNCPDDSFTGNIVQFKDHIKASHNTYTFPVSFSINNKKENMFFLHMDELYCLSYDSNCDCGLLLLNVFLIGPKELSTKRIFKINLTSLGGYVHYQKQQVLPITDFQIDENNAVKVEFNVLRMKLRMQNDKKYNLSIQISNRRFLYNSEDVHLQDVECIVCQEVMFAPIYLCEAGHSICNYCFLKVAFCPMCRGKMATTRNFALETVTSRLTYRCIYSEEGCDFSSGILEICDHERSCNFGFFDCPLKAFITSCEWRGAFSEMSSHALEDHGFKF